MVTKIKYFLLLWSIGLAIANSQSEKSFQQGLDLLKSDSIAANKLFVIAGEQNYPPAIKALADSYMAGDGVSKNVNKALLLYVRAAELRYGPAQFSAGVLLQNGDAGFVNLLMSFYYLCLASINIDLGDLQKDAAYYRDLVAMKLNSDQIMQAYTQINQFLLKKKH